MHPPLTDYDARLECYRKELQSRFGRKLKGFTPVFYTFENALMAAACLDISWRVAEFILRHSAGNHNVHTVGCSGRPENRCGRCDDLGKSGKPLNQSDIGKALELDRRRISPAVRALRQLGLIDVDKRGIFPIPNPELWLTHVEPIAPVVDHAADRRQYEALYPDEARELAEIERARAEIAARHKAAKLAMLAKIRAIKSVKATEFVHTSRTNGQPELVHTSRTNGEPESVHTSRTNGANRPAQTPAPAHPNAPVPIDSEVTELLGALRAHDPGAERRDAAALLGECRRRAPDCHAGDVVLMLDRKAAEAHRGRKVRAIVPWLLTSVPPKFDDDAWLAICRLKPRDGPARAPEDRTKEIEYEEYVKNLVDQHCVAMAQAEFDIRVSKYLPSVKQSYPRMSKMGQYDIAILQLRAELRADPSIVPTWEQYVRAHQVSPPA